MGCNETIQNHNHSSCDVCQRDGYVHQVVETYADVADFRNAFVTVRDENAVYHVDEVGNPVSVSRSPIFIENYEPTVGAWRQNLVYDFIANKAYVFAPDGTFREIELS